MLRVFKYTIPQSDTFTLMLPKDAQVLTVQTQRGIDITWSFDTNPVMWMLVDPDAPAEQRAFRIVGTGKPITESAERLSYIGTFQLADGQLVFHLFEII